MTILDLKCAVAGENLKADKKEELNLIRDVLSVLQENDIYAMFLYILSQASKVFYAQSVCQKLWNTLVDEEMNLGLTSIPPIDYQQTGSSQNVNILSNSLRPILVDIYKMFLAREILDRTLTYGLYHSKPESQQTQLGE